MIAKERVHQLHLGTPPHTWCLCDHVMEDTWWVSHCHHEHFPGPGSLIVSDRDQWWHLNINSDLPSISWAPVSDHCWCCNTCSWSRDESRNSFLISPSLSCWKLSWKPHQRSVHKRKVDVLHGGVCVGKVGEQWGASRLELPMDTEVSAPGHK